MTPSSSSPSPHVSTPLNSVFWGGQVDRFLLSDFKSTPTGRGTHGCCRLTIIYSSTHANPFFKIQTRLM